MHGMLSSVPTACPPHTTGWSRISLRAYQAELLASAHATARLYGEALKSNGYALQKIPIPG